MKTINDIMLVAEPEDFTMVLEDSLDIALALTQQVISPSEIRDLHQINPDSLRDYFEDFVKNYLWKMTPSEFLATYEFRKRMKPESIAVILVLEDAVVK